MVVARLPDPSFLARPGVAPLLRALNPASGAGQTRVVGGAIRNALIGVPVTDVDCATVFSPDEVMRLASGAGFHVVPTGIDHGTVTVIVAGVAHEVTTLRRDVEADGRHAIVAFGTDWAEDARRRDLTINALYCDLDGTLHDPLGVLPDVLARRIRFIGDAEARIREDYLRLLRFFRFHAQYGAGPLDPAGLRASIRLRQGLDRLSAERIRQEILKLLVAPAAEDVLAVMSDNGILTRLLGVLELGRFHRLLAVEAAQGAAPNALERLAALAVRTVEDAERLGQRLRLSRAEESALERMAQWAPRLARAPSSKFGRQVLYETGEDYRAVVRLAWAESRCDAADPLWSGFARLPDERPIPAFPIRGADLLAMGVPAGPRLGALLAAAEAWWREDDFAASREDLLGYVRGCLAGKSDQAT